MYAGDEFYPDEVTSGELTDDGPCLHDHVERDDDGFRRFFVCLDCDEEVIPTGPDEDGKTYWEVMS